jgi:hypothetical protein
VGESESWHQLAAGAKKRSKLDKPKTAALIVAWVSEGKSDAEVASLLARRRTKTTRQAVTKFRARHAGEIAAITTQAVAELRDVAIADKGERVRRAGIVGDKIMEWVETHGLVGETATSSGDGQVVRRIKRLDRSIVAALVELQRYVSEELLSVPEDEHGNARPIPLIIYRAAGEPGEKP